MDYTVGVKWTFLCNLGLCFALLLTACGGLFPLQATPTPDSEPINRPLPANRDLQTSLPEVCNCVLRFEHLGIEQGMSQSSALAIFQDSRGFMWFGTQDGLNRFDGHTFKIYKPDPDDPDTISDRWITSIVEDLQGYLWIATRQGGLNRFDPRLESFTHFTHSDSNNTSLSDNHINTLFVDEAGTLWVGTDSGLNRLNPGSTTFTKYLTALSQPKADSSVSIMSIHEDQYGFLWLGTSGNGLIKFNPHTARYETFQTNTQNPSTISNDFVNAIAEEPRDYILWIGTRNGLNRFDPNTGRFTRFQREEMDLEDNPLDEILLTEPIGPSNIYQDLSSNIINTLQFDSSGNLWVGTSAGLNRYQPGGGFVHYLNDPVYSKSLSDNRVLSFHEDRSGILWIGTGNGVNKYDRHRDVFAYYRHDPLDGSTINANSITAIHVDAEGYAWIGTGNGLNALNLQTNRAIHYEHDGRRDTSLGSNDVTAITEDQNGFLWIGTTNGLDRFNRANSTFTHFRRDPNDSTGLSSNFVYTVYVDSHNNVWVGTYAGLDKLDSAGDTFTHYAYKRDDANSLSGSTVIAIHEDRDGSIWAGTFESGLNRLDPKTGKFTHYRYNPLDKDSLNNDSVLSLYQDRKGRLWIGTAGGGLNLYHSETNSFTHYLEKDGLPNGVVYGILEDKQGDLWLSTNFGLSRFNPETEVFRNFDVGDGLQSNEFNSNAYAKGRDGRLYFGGVNGLTVFHPSEVAASAYLPQVVLTSLTQNDQSLATDVSVETLQTFTLQYPLNSFEFNFTALSYSQPDENQYAYFLEGFDTNWHYIGTKRDGRYTNIPGGEYTLLLKAANSDGVWNETPTRINVTVIPPYWQTNWFRVLVFIGALVVLAGAIRLRTRAIQDRNRALERLVRERTYALENRNREIEALYKADERILRNVSMNQVFQTLVDVAVDTLNANRSTVLAWDDKQARIVPRVSRGFSPQTLEVLKFARGEGTVGKAFETGKPIIVRQIELNDFRPDVREALIAEGIRSFAHIPIMVDDRIVGVFNAGFTRPNLIGDDITRLFSALTHRASISIANMQLFEQTKELAVMEERNRLARDLHDSAKQKAFAALAQLGTARGILNGNGDSVSMHLNEAENLVSDVIQELTFLVQEIYPIALQEKGLAPTLREYIYEWENRNDAEVNFFVRNERRFPLEIEQAIYRVTQEALANVARHSQARQVDISLMYQEDIIQLSIADDGLGFDMNARPHGMGLRSIRERVGSVHGTAQIQSAPGHGTRIIVQVPVKR